MKKILFTALLAGGIFLLFTCNNEIDLIYEIRTEVKIANDKFLIIESVSPGDLNTNVNPGSDIIIVFDRALDMETVTSDTVSIYNETTVNDEEVLSSWYNSSTNTLNIKPTINGYFNNLNDYTIKISGLRGEDGSEMQSEYIWSFKTGLAPAGAIIAVDRSGPAVAGYTNEATVNVSVTSKNEFVSSYVVSGTESDLLNPQTIDDGSWKPAAEGFSDIPISDVEGNVSVYCVFRGVIGSEMTYSRIQSYNIVLDKTAPVVNAGVNQISNGVITQTGSVEELYVHSYSWSGTSLYFGSPSSISTTISVGTDGDYTARLTVMDKAGNSGYGDMVFTKDTVPPAGPTTTAVTTTPTTDTTPTFSWSSNAADGSGTYDIKYYSYSYTSSTGQWSYSPGVTTLTTYSPAITVSSIDRVLVTLWASEQDLAGNWSPFRYDAQIIVSRYLPYNTQTNVSAKPRFEWPAGLKGTTYIVQTFTGSRWIDLFSSTTNYYLLGKTESLPSGTYIWRVKYTRYSTITYSDPLQFTVP